MPMIDVEFPFHVQMENGMSYQFYAGRMFVPEALLNHPLVKAHLDAQEQPADAEAPTQPASVDEGLTTATDDRQALLADAERLGVQVDKRWGIDRIRAAVAASSQAQ